MSFLKCSVALLYMILQVQDQCNAKRAVLRKFQMCDLKYNYPIFFNASLKMVDESQYLDITAIFKIPFGENQWLNLTFEYSPNGQRFIPFFKFTRTNLCDFLTKDVGPLWFDIQKQIGVPARSCPVPIGRYNLRNFEIQYNKIHMPMPSGSIRSSMNILENRSDKILSCLTFLSEIFDD